QSRCLFTDEMPKRRMKWLYDARTMLKWIPDTDWAAIAERANELHCMYRVHLMMKFFAICYPETISLDEVKTLFPVDSGYALWLKHAAEFREMTLSYMKERSENPDLSITPRVVKLLMK